MQIKNIKIFDSTAAANGSWIDISNLVAFSVDLTGLDAASVWIEASNDPYINIDGFNSSGGALVQPPSAPALSQGPAAFLLPGYPIYSPGYTLYVKITYVTPWGESSPSNESNIVMTTGNILTVVSPGPEATGLATGYNVYIGTSSNAEVLQTMPPYTPAHVVDATPGLHFAISGAVGLSQNFTLPNGYFNSGVNPPSYSPPSSTAGGIGTGINVSGTFTGSGYTAPTGTFLSVNAVVDTTLKQGMFTPSGFTWKWIRVVKSGSGTSETIAWLDGQNG